MANESAWDQGFALGQGRAQERRARKQAITDEEREQRATELANERVALQNKYATTLDVDGKPTDATKAVEDALQKNVSDLREFYHPEKNPGAIQRWGHILTDKIGLSSPQQRAQEQKARMDKHALEDQTAARAIEAAAPLSPGQTELSQIQAQLAMIDKSGLPDADKDEAKRAVFKIMARPEFKPYKLPDGSIQYFDATRPDEIPEGATAYVAENSDTRKRADYAAFLLKNPDYEVKGGNFEKWMKEQNPSVSAINEGREDYAQSYGFGSFNDIPAGLRDDAMNYVIRKQTLDKLYGKTATVTTIKQDVNGQEIPIQVTNYITPDGAEKLIDPLAKAGYRRSAVSTPSGQGAAPSSYRTNSTSQTMVTPNPKGLVEPGNINIWSRPTVQNADGSHSSELSISIGTDKGEVLIPTIADGKFLTPDGKMPPLVNGKVPPASEWDKYPAWKALRAAAVKRYQDTKENLGTFSSPQDADAYAQILHNRGQAPNKTATSSHGATPTPKAGGPTARVGTPLFQGSNTTIAHAKNDVVEATKLSSLADQVAQRPDDAVNQKRLAAALEKASAGRFTVQALDYIMKAGWGNTIQQWINNPTTGALPPDIVRQLVDGAHENLKASKDALQSAIYGAAQQQTGDPDTDAIINALNNSKKKTP